VSASRGPGSGAGSNNPGQRFDWVGNLAPDREMTWFSCRLRHDYPTSMIWPPATTINSITFSGSDYLIDGNAITLNAYLSNSSRH